MLGDIFYRLGTLAGTAWGAVETSLPEDTVELFNGDGGPQPASLTPDSDDSENDGGAGASDGDMLVDTILGSVAAWTVAKLLRPRRVSWPRVVVAGIGATVLADVVGRAAGADSEARDRAYDEDPDALLVRLGAGIAMAAGYAALLYPRLPGSPLAKGMVFSAMEIAALPHGGLVRVATDTPGLKFPLKDLAVPIDEEAGVLESLAFGAALGLLYRPRVRDHDPDEDGEGLEAEEDDE